MSGSDKTVKLGFIGDGGLFKPKVQNDSTPPQSGQKYEMKVVPPSPTPPQSPLRASPNPAPAQTPVPQSNSPAPVSTPASSPPTSTLADQEVVLEPRIPLTPERSLLDAKHNYDVKAKQIEFLQKEITATKRHVDLANYYKTLLRRFSISTQEQQNNIKTWLESKTEVISAVAHRSKIQKKLAQAEEMLQSVSTEISHWKEVQKINATVQTVEDENKDGGKPDSKKEQDIKVESQKYLAITLKLHWQIPKLEKDLEVLNTKNAELAKEIEANIKSFSVEFHGALTLLAMLLHTKGSKPFSSKEELLSQLKQALPDALQPVLKDIETAKNKGAQTLQKLQQSRQKLLELNPSLATSEISA